jgi:hypothetical protein
MSDKEKGLKQALESAEISEVDLESVSGGLAMTCNESCQTGCSQCCESGSANRGPAGVEPVQRLG